MNLLTEKVNNLETKLAAADAAIAEMRDKIQQLENAKAAFANLPARVTELNAEIKLLQFDSIKFGPVAMKENKWNAKRCGPNLKMDEDGFTVSFIGSFLGWLSIWAEMPIRLFKCAMLEMPKIACYFEVEKIEDLGVGIGFAENEFPSATETVGSAKNSIGVWSKEEILINGLEIRLQKFNGKFCKEDVIGCGLVHSTANSPIKYFATCNGELLGSVELPANFVGLQLYPAATLYSGESIKANFGKEPFLFDTNKIQSIE